MFRRAWWCLAALWCGIAAAQEAGPQIPSLVLRQDGEQLLGCLPKDASAMNVEGAIVVAFNGDWPPDEWALVHVPGANVLRLEAGECVTYNRDIPGYKQVGAGKPLLAGKTYSFAVRDNSRATYWAQGLRMTYFCRDDSASGVRFFPFIDHDDGTTTYPSCGSYIGRPPAPDGIVPSGTPDNLK